MAGKRDARVMALILKAWRGLILEGYHRPNEELGWLEDALLELGMSGTDLDEEYEDLRS